MRFRHRFEVFVLVCVLALSGARTLHAQTGRGTIALEVDAREVSREILHARLTIPATPGPLTLHYVKWIPGNHRPNGPIEHLTGLEMSSGGRRVAWVRDSLDNYTFHVTVPPGAQALDVRLDFVLAHASHAVAMLNWNQVVLYPAGWPAREIMMAPRVLLPAGWESASALEAARRESGRVAFAPVDLVTLVDSPVLMGAHLRRFPLGDAGSGAPVELDVACDSEEGLALKPATLAGFRRLVGEARALLGPPPYRRFHFLTGLSDFIPGEGLEHHESTDIRMKERVMVDGEALVSEIDVFAHELAHAWNGKAHRPAGLTFTDFQHPESAELLWVYEGLTQYLGYVLDGRSGLLTPEQARMQFATTAAALDAAPGRGWRNVHDTAVTTGPLRGAARAWSAWRRGQDYYGEGALIWLEADATIRRLSGGARSLDDFCRRFLAATPGPPRVRSYTEADVIAALEATQPHDWRRFVDERVRGLATPTPTRAFEAAGWKLVYADTLTGYEAAVLATAEFKNLRPSLGMRLDNAGLVTDVVPDRPAAKAGVAPGMRLLGVDGRKYTYKRLEDAIKRAKTSGKPIELLVDDGDFYQVVKVDHRAGMRFVALERAPGTPDHLGAILAPHTAREAKGR